MKYIKTTILLAIIFLSCNCVIAQPESKVPRPPFADVPCFYIEGKTDVWKLEKHSNSTFGAFQGNALNVEQVFDKVMKKGSGYILEGASSGVVIKSSDDFAFIIRNKTEESFDMNKIKISAIEKNMSETTNPNILASYKKQLAEVQEELAESYRLKLFKVNVVGNERKFFEKDAQIPLTIEKLPGEIERAVPARKLKPGEYVILYKSVYTFRIE